MSVSKVVNTKITLTLFGLVLALSIFALGILGNEGLGWFASNDRTEANNMSISVDGDFGVVKSVEYFSISSISLDGSNNIYIFKDLLSEDEPKSLGQFSTLVAERQILVRITLHDSVGRVQISANSSASEYIADATPSITRDNNSLSSVVELYSISGEFVDYTENGYVISSENFQGDSSRFSSVTIDDTVHVDFKKDIPVYETQSGVDENSVYIIIDYYEDAAKHVMDVAAELIADGSITFDENDDDQIITFAPDFKLTVIKIA